MSFYTEIVETVQIDSENAITLKAPTYGVVQDIQSKSMAVSFGQDGKGQADLDITKMEQLTVHACVVSWSGPGFEGRPVSPENIDALPAYVIESIKPTIDRLTSPMKNKTKKS